MKVYLSSGRLKLVTGHAIYSYEDKYLNFVEAFKFVDIAHRATGRVLVLGLGLGSIPYILEKKFKLRLNYTCVELDSVVIELYEEFTQKKLKSQFNIVQDDGYDYLLRSSDQFDLICMDIFSDAKIPTKFSTIDFLKLLEKNLSPNGIMIYNRLAENQQDVALNEQFDLVFSKIFPYRKLLKLNTNSMYIAEK
ncbi:MAG: fused MFS/spermidine synthase [Saprospiraceae bacterium]